jgi:hypothetical protein
VDEDRARALLAAERARVEALISGLQVDRSEDRAAEEDSADWSDPAQPLTAEGADDAVSAGLEVRLRCSAVRPSRTSVSKPTPPPSSRSRRLPPSTDIPGRATRCQSALRVAGPLQGLDGRSAIA